MARRVSLGAVHTHTHTHTHTHVIGLSKKIEHKDMMYLCDFVLCKII